MSSWLLVYLISGLMISEIANAGHMRLYGRPIGALFYTCGVLFWPIILIIGSIK